MPQQQFVEPTSYKSLCDLLSAKDIAPPTPERMQAVTEQYGRERIIRALRELYQRRDHQTKGARKFLNEIFPPDDPSFDDNAADGQPPEDPQDPQDFDGQQSSGRPPQGQEGTRGNAPQGRDWTKHLSTHVYGGKAALCFEADTLRPPKKAPEGTEGAPTVAIDAAVCTGTRTYDFENKTRIQLTKYELPVLLAVFLGIKQSCEFKSHGENKDKGFSAENQDGKIFFKVFSPAGVRAVPITPDDAFRVSRILLRQLCGNMPDGLGGTELMGLLRQTIGRF